MLTAASVAATDLALLAGAEAAARMGDVTGASRLRAAFVSAWDPAQRSPAIERRVHALEGAGISRP
jgi:hypothetical protein